MNHRDGSAGAVRSAAGTTAGQPTARALETILGIRIRRLQQLVLKHWADWFGRLGLELTPVQGGVLLVIDENPGLTQTALARLLQVEAPTLAEVLRPLIEAGWVTKAPAAVDGRAIALGLTPDGQRAAGSVRKNAIAHEAELFGALSASEHAALIGLLDKALAGARSVVGR